MRTVVDVLIKRKGSVAIKNGQNVLTLYKGGLRDKKMKLFAIAAALFLLVVGFLAYRRGTRPDSQVLGQRAALMNGRIRELAESFHSKHQRWPSSISEINRAFPNDSYVFDLTNRGSRLQINPENAYIKIVRQDKNACDYRMNILGFNQTNTAED